MSLIKNITKISSAFLKTFTLAGILLLILGASPSPSNQTVSVNPLGQTNVHAGLVDDINILGYKCLFPESETGKCKGGGDALMTNIVDWLINLSGVIAVLVLVWGGYRYFIGTVSEDKEAGLRTIKAGVIGFSFVLLAKGIQAMIEGTFVDDGDKVGFSISGIYEPVKDFLGVFIPLSGVVAIAFLVYGGYLLMTASGNEERSANGMKAIKNAVIGLVVVLLATTIVQIINTLYKGSL